MSVFWILVGIFVLGLMVLAHEWGHFIVAKMLGVRVEVFSIGFGPRLFGLKRGPTDYRLSILPLGGYVKMAGDNPAGEREGAPDEFLSKPRWARVLIVAAGPVTNVILAVVLLAGLYAVHYERAAYLDEPTRLEGVVEDSPAALAGLEAGDVIVEIKGKPQPSWQDVEIETALGGTEPLPVTVMRNGERLEFVVQPELRGSRDIGYAGWYPYDPVVITEVEPGLPAARAGMQPEDEVVAVQGASTSEVGVGGFVERIKESEGTPVELTVRRGGQTLDMSVTPEERDWRGQKGYVVGIGIGRRTTTVQLGPVAALQQSISDNLGFAGLLFDVLQRLFSGRASMRNLEGPIGITVLSGQAARLGLGSLVNLMAIISMNLAVLNLLPVPILDGGHIALLAVEGVRRKDLSLQFKERVTQVGFLLLMLLFAVVMYNDILRYFFQ